MGFNKFKDWFLGVEEAPLPVPTPEAILEAEPRIVAGIMTAVHCENDPHLGIVLEAILIGATERVLSQGVSVHDSYRILEAKDAAYKWTMAKWDKGESPVDILTEAQSFPWEE